RLEPRPARQADLARDHQLGLAQGSKAIGYRTLRDALAVGMMAVEPAACIGCAGTQVMEQLLRALFLLLHVEAERVGRASWGEGGRGRAHSGVADDRSGDASFPWGRGPPVGQERVVKERAALRWVVGAALSGDVEASTEPILELGAIRRPVKGRAIAFDP